MCFSTALSPLPSLLGILHAAPVLSLSLSVPDTLDMSLSLRDPEGPYFLCEETRPDRLTLYLPSHTLYKAIGNSKLHLCPFVFLASCAFTEAKI